MPKFNEFVFGTNPKIKQASLQSPEQMQLLSLIQQGLSSKGELADLFGGFNTQKFQEQVSAPIMQDYLRNILPQIQEKFIAGNQTLGSGMQRAQAKAGTDLQTQLMQMLYAAQQDQNKNRQFGISNILGARPFENVAFQGNTGVLAAMLQGLASGAGSGLGAAMMGG